MFAVFKIDLPFDERTSGSSDRSIYRSFKRSDVSAYNGEIFPFDLMPGGMEDKILELTICFATTVDRKCPGQDGLYSGK